jgi:hypothetical protein
VVLVGVATRLVPRLVTEEHLDELERLVDTAGGEVVGRFVKERSAPDPKTYIGKGSVEEIGESAREKGATLVVFDDELTPGQARNLEERWSEGLRAMDRPGIILTSCVARADARGAHAGRARAAPVPAAAPGGPVRAPLAHGRRHRRPDRAEQSSRWIAARSASASPASGAISP